jgi:hypothetical protein
MGESSRSLGDRLKERPAFLGALSDMSGGKVVPVPGGVLIMDGNTIIGAVGASGAQPTRTKRASRHKAAGWREAKLNDHRERAHRLCTTKARRTRSLNKFSSS